MKTIKELAEMIIKMEQDLFPFPHYEVKESYILIKPCLFQEVKIKLSEPLRHEKTGKPFVMINEDFMSQSILVESKDESEICDFIRSLCKFQ